MLRSLIEIGNSSNLQCQPLHFRFYVITDRALCAPRSLYEVIHDLLDVGVSAIQLRENDLSDVELVKLAEPILELCHGYSAQLFINSRVEIATTLGTDGVHLPGISNDIRKVKQTNSCLIIGCSVHTIDEAKKREMEGADFIAYSPIYPTVSKPGYGPAVGLGNLRRVAETANIPVFALGGITPERVSECIGAGAYGIAVMSGVMSSENGAHQAKAYLQQLRDVERNV